MNIADLRLSYTHGNFSEAEARPDPADQFALWFEQARKAGNPEPNAMTLATASASGEPNARMVLLKGFGPGGFVFYTNYQSPKAAELKANPRATLLFYWPELERQVRIHGTVERVSTEESTAYFHSRPVGHQLGAWASRQSTVISGREVIEEHLRAAKETFRSAEIPLPPFWGGYRVKPLTFEFWQGRPNRLHDRLEYFRGPNGDWQIRRLSP
jgi:pyridoxamine 5'-phosphate oxidase